MERGAKRAHCGVIIALLHVIRHAGGNKALRKAAEQIIEIAAGDQIIVLLLHCDDQDRIIFRKLHLDGVIIRRILYVVCGFGRDDGHDAAKHLVPVGIVEADGLLSLVGKNIGIIAHILRKGRRGK